MVSPSLSEKSFVGAEGIGAAGCFRLCVDYISIDKGKGMLALVTNSPLANARTHRVDSCKATLKSNASVLSMNPCICVSVE